MSASAITLWSARACPFAHRTRLVLAEKALKFELIEIDLQNKPAWFAEVSVYGKVPALEHAGQRFVESAIVNEYIEEVFPSPRLLPTAAAERALARFWIDYANTRFVPAWGKLLRASEPALASQAAAELRESLETLERGLAQHSGSGPYWFGAEPSLVDFSLYPWFERWPALSHYRQLEVPSSLGRLHQLAKGRERTSIGARHRKSDQLLCSSATRVTPIRIASQNAQLRLSSARRPSRRPVIGRGLLWRQQSSRFAWGGSRLSLV